MFHVFSPTRLVTTVVLASAIFSASLVFAQATTQPATTQPAAKDSYPLTTCIVSGGKLGGMGKPYVMQVEGREVRLCCKGCEAKVKADPAKYLKKMDDMIIAAQMPTYPRKTCVVSGDELGKPEDTFNVVRQNRLIRLCCESCIKELDKDPAGFAAKVDEPDTKTK